MKIILAVISALIFLLAGNVSGLEMLSDLVVNYGDFSYISAISVGYDYAYFGTTNGVIRYKIASHAWGDPMTGIAGLQGRQIQAISSSSDDNYLWVRTEFGIFEYSNALNQWLPIARVNAETGQAKHLEPNQLYFPPFGYNYLEGGILVDNDNNEYRLTDIVDDGWTNLWIGTWGLGAIHADNHNLRMELIPFGLIQPDISTIYVDNGILLMGGLSENTGRNGVTIFDWRQNRFEYIETKAGLIFSAVNVNDITSNEKDIFIATDDGVWVVDRNKHTITQKLSHKSGLPNNRILTVLAIGDTLFAGSEFGLGILNIYNDSSITGKNIFLPSLVITSIQDIDGYLMIGTTQGAYRLDLSTGKIARLNIPEVSRTVYDIKDDSAKIWLAMDNYLVAIDKQSAEIESYPEVQNYGGARAIAVNDTIIATATPHGLLIFYNGPHPHHQLFSIEDGLISNDIKDLVFDGDYLWLGTDRGLTRFFYKHPSIGF
jgi:ligand-binding sensor domain-containing protein